MPISNPLVAITVYESASNVLIQSSDPTLPPTDTNTFWLNSNSDRLWLSKGTQSVDDWVSLGGNGSANPDLLNQILIANGEILTTEQTVIYQD